MSYNILFPASPLLSPSLSVISLHSNECLTALWSACPSTFTKHSNLKLSRLPRFNLTHGQTYLRKKIRLTACGGRWDGLSAFRYQQYVLSRPSVDRSFPAFECKLTEIVQKSASVLMESSDEDDKEVFSAVTALVQESWGFVIPSQVIFSMCSRCASLMWKVFKRVGIKYNRSMVLIYFIGPIHFSLFSSLSVEPCESGIPTFSNPPLVRVCLQLKSL